MSQDKSRKIELAAKVTPVFGKKYLYIKIGKVSHPGSQFTPNGNSFAIDDFEIISDASSNFSESTLVLPPASSASQILIFTDQPRNPKGTVFVKNIDAYKGKIIAAVKAYNEQYSEGYDFSKSLSSDEELIA